MTKIESYVASVQSELLSKPVTKFIVISDHLNSDIGSDDSTPYGTCRGALLRLHTLQDSQ